MIRVTHALADTPELFDTTVFGTENGVLFIYDPSGKSVMRIFNREVWAAVEAIAEADRGSF